MTANKASAIIKTGKTAAELYDVQPDYQRFDQKNNMTRQHLWNPPAVEQRQRANQNLRQNIENNRPGYGKIDWAFYAAANANMTSTGFPINWPNRRGNSWQSVSRLSQVQSFVPVTQT